VTIHELGDYALARLALSPPGDRPAARLAESALRCLFSFQVFARPALPEQGLFRFHAGDPPRLADNANEFALLSVAILLQRFSVSTTLLAELVPRLEAGFDAIERHGVCPSYTNICLIQLAENLALGQALGRTLDPSLRRFGQARIRAGERRLDEWLRFTRAYGIHEFDSPTYTEVALEALLAAFAAAPDVVTRQDVRAALDYFWSDVAANTFAGRGSLTGPHSRSYDFIAGQGGLTVSMYLEGLRDELPSQAPDGSKILLWLNLADGGYQPAAGALCWSALPRRVILSTYGPNAAATGQERYAFVTGEFAVGSASADYGPQDQLISAELASSPRTPAISVVPDYLDAPGTQVRAGDFTKIAHLPMSPSSAQKDGAVLTLLRVSAADPHYQKPGGGALPLVSLATNVIAPVALDELYIDGMAATPGEPRSLPLRPTLTLRVAHAAIAIGVVDIGGLECPDDDGHIVSLTQPTLIWKPLAPASTARDSSARLAIYHASTVPSDTAPLARCFARVALLLMGSTCTTASCASDLGRRVQGAVATAQRRFDRHTGDWDILVRVEDGPQLHVHRIVGSLERVLAREVDGQPIRFPPLSVNGAPILIRSTRENGR
jgi:hypothetical protein